MFMTTDPLVYQKDSHDLAESLPTPRRVSYPNR